MRAAYYEKNGPAREVLRVGEVPTSTPAPGEVRVKLATSGVNLRLTEERWPKLKFHATREHSAKLV